MKEEIKEILNEIKDTVNAYAKSCDYKENDIIYDEVNFSVKQWNKLLDYITNLEQENEKLLKTQKMYENKCNKIHQYIVQNCEIIRHKDYDEIGKVNGGHILTLLADGDEE